MVEIWTDGACSGNPGPGGWAAVLVAGTQRLSLWGSEPHTTNNRMEMVGVIEGLARMRDATSVLVVTDSRYVHDAVVKGWIDGWGRRGWRKANGDPVKNPDLWQQLAEQLARLDVHWRAVLGHRGVELNEVADRLAVHARKRAQAGHAERGERRERIG